MAAAAVPTSSSSRSQAPRRRSRSRSPLHQANHDDCDEEDRPRASSSSAHHDRDYNKAPAVHMVDVQEMYVTLMQNGDDTERISDVAPLLGIPPVTGGDRGDGSGGGGGAMAPCARNEAK